MIPYSVQNYFWNLYLKYYDMSNMLVFFLCFLLFSMLVLRCIDCLVCNWDLPPGPWGIPFLGRLPWIRENSLHTTYLSLADRYGDVFSLRIGHRVVVCISSPNILHETLNKLDVIERPNTFVSHLYEGYGVLLSESEEWNRQCELLNEKLLRLGVKMWSSQRFEQRIINEVKAMIMDIGHKTGQSHNPSGLIDRYIYNVICQLIMSHRFSNEDPKFKFLKRRFKRVKKLFSNIFIGQYLSLYMYLPRKREVLVKIQSNLENINRFCESHLTARAASLNPNSIKLQPRDLLDCFHKQLLESTQYDVSPHEKQFIQLMSDLIYAGTETTKTALAWLIIMMLRETQVAEKVRKDIRKVVKVTGLVTLNHTLKLPYVEAVIFETLRIISIVPLGSSHISRSQCKIGNYIIPAGTTIIPLINKINMNPKFFPQPEKFIPERFLSGGTVFTPDYFIPFGVGRRTCLGEQLARMELFLFFANLMNFFNFTLAIGQELPSLEGYFDIIHMPNQLKVIFHKITADTH